MQLRPPFAACAALALLTVAAAPASVATAAELFPGVAPVGAEALGAARGGMRVGDFDIDVGIVMRTAVDGAPFLTSTLILGDGMALDLSDPEALTGAGLAGRSAIPGLDVTHDFTGVPQATVRNTLDRLTVDHLTRVDITVRNFRDRIATFRSQRIAEGAVRRSMIER